VKVNRGLPRAGATLAGPRGCNADREDIWQHTQYHCPEKSTKARLGRILEHITRRCGTYIYGGSSPTIQTARNG
jgi:hypothetical protein